MNTLFGTTLTQTTPPPQFNILLRLMLGQMQDMNEKFQKINKEKEELQLTCQKMGEELNKYKNLAELNTLTQVKIEAHDHINHSRNNSDLDTDSSEYGDNLKISVSSKAIHKNTDNKGHKRLEMEKNWLPITINGFAIWVSLNENVVSEIVQREGLADKICSLDVLNYNHNKIDRKGHGNTNDSETKDRQYKITSKKKLSDVFVETSEDDDKTKAIKTVMRALLKEFFTNHPQFFVKHTRASQENKDYWLNNLAKLKRKIFGALNMLETSH